MYSITILSWRLNGYKNILKNSKIIHWLQYSQTSNTIETTSKDVYSPKLNELIYFVDCTTINLILANIYFTTLLITNNNCNFLRMYTGIHVQNLILKKYNNTQNSKFITVVYEIVLPNYIFFRANLDNLANYKIFICV